MVISAGRRLPAEVAFMLAVGWLFVVYNPQCTRPDFNAAGKILPAEFF
jgi:hypothetical protein